MHLKVISHQLNDHIFFMKEKGGEISYPLEANTILIDVKGSLISRERSIAIGSIFNFPIAISLKSKSRIISFLPDQ